MNPAWRTGKGAQKEDLVGLESTFTIKRSDYDMTYGVGPVSDEVTIEEAAATTRARVAS